MLAIRTQEKRNCEEKKCTYFLTLLLYTSIDTVLFGTNSNPLFLYLQYIFLILAMIFLLGRGFRTSENTVFILFVLIGLSLFTGILKTDLSLKYFYEIVIILIGFLFSLRFSFSTFISAYINSTTFIAITSVIVYFIARLFPGLVSRFPIVVNTANVGFYNLFFALVPVNRYYVNRNWSFFREPGVTAIFLLIGVSFLLFYRNRDSCKHYVTKIIFFMIAIVATRSTGGVISLAFLLCGYFIVARGNGKNKRTVLLLIILFVVALVSANVLSMSIFGKLTTENASLISRTNSIPTNLVIISKNLFFGCGWDNIDVLFEMESINRLGSALQFGESAYHNTNTVLKYCAVHGVPFYVVFGAGFLKCFLKTCNTKMEFIAIVLTIFLSLMNEDLTLNFIIPVIVFYGYRIGTSDEVVNVNNGLQQRSERNCSVEHDKFRSKL